MVQVKLDIPETLANLPAQELILLIRAGLYEAMQARIRQLELEIIESREQLKRFEARYGVSFDQFESEILSTLDTMQAHEDYTEWFFWENVFTEKQQVLTELQRTKWD